MSQIGIPTAAKQVGFGCPRLYFIKKLERKFQYAKADNQMGEFPT